jgi:hypothetical protein
MPYLGNIPATNFSTISYQDLTGGTGTSFTLDFPAGSAQDIEVFVNNVRQEPGVAYTVAGTSLTMTGSIVATDDFYVVFQGKAQQTVVPGPNTITAAMLQSGAVPDAITKVTSDPTATTNASLGDVYVNTTTGEMFVCTNATTNNNVWINVGEGSGNINASYSADFLVIAGGGGGGLHSGGGGGGGGAGGYRASYNSEASGGGGSSESSLTLGKGITYTITVGAGGVGSTGYNVAGAAGGDSSVAGSNITTVTSAGGGGGASTPSGAATTGGSGGGGSGNGGPAASAGTSNQGFAGGAGGAGGTTGGGGGGGAGAVGAAGSASGGGNGGTGVASTITGSSVTHAGGGGGGHDSRAGGSGGTGGTGGGGAGGKGVVGTAGTANTGGGGGGTGYNASTGGAGGSGVVILRMPTAKYSGTTTGSPTVTTDGTDTILTYTSSGTYVG